MSATPAAAAPLAWRDPKRFLWPLALLTPLLPIEAWLLVQAAFAVTLLEVVNYIQRYGLVREKRPDGRYERLRAEHSWNAATVASNVALYNVPPLWRRVMDPRLPAAR